MKISVIIPIYNTELYLKKCIDSVVNQTYSNLEIILVNDGSTDNSLSIIREYEKADSRVIVIDQPNGGQSMARNAALDIMTGDYLTFVDSDDYLSIDTLENVMNMMSSSENIDMIAFPIELIYGDESVKSFYSFTESFIKDYDPKLSKVILHGISPYEVCGKVYKSSIFQDMRFSKGEEYEDTLIFPDIDRKLRIIGYSVLGKYYYCQCCYYQKYGNSMNTLSLSHFKMRLETMRHFFDYLYLEKSPNISRTTLVSEYYIVLDTIKSGFSKKWFYLPKFILKGKLSRFFGAPMKYFMRFVYNAYLKRILFLISFFCISSLSFGQHPASVCELGFNYTISRQNNWGFSKPVVTSVHIGSPAEKAGLKINDIIERIDGQPSDRYYSDAIFALLHEERYIKLIVSNLEYRNKELIFSKDCNLMDAISEKQMAADLAPYSLGNVEEKIFIRNFKTTVTQSPQINFLNYKTFGFKENAHQNNSDKFLNNRIKTVLEKRGLIYSAKNPNLFISTNVLSYKEGEEFVRITISFIDPRYSTEEEPYVIWQCTAKDYETVPDSDISLMLMQYPFPQTLDEARFRHFKKRYNYTGIVYDMNDFRKIFYVDPVSPASLAGIETGDVILKINNIKMVENSKQPKYKAVFSYLFDFNNSVLFNVKRGKQQLKIQVEPITMEYELFENY